MYSLCGFLPVGYLKVLHCASISLIYRTIMLTNDILRSLRYLLCTDNTGLVRLLALADIEATPSQMARWARKEEEEGFQRCPDIILAGVLNGLIYDKSGRDDGRPALATERRLDNTIVLKKLRVAFALKTDDILAILTTQQFRVSMPEITAMMRAPDHKNFRPCGDQFLRYFLRGLVARERRE